MDSRTHVYTLLRPDTLTHTRTLTHTDTLCAHTLIRAHSDMSYTHLHTDTFRVYTHTVVAHTDTFHTHAHILVRTHQHIPCTHTYAHLYIHTLVHFISYTPTRGLRTLRTGPSLVNVSTSSGTPLFFGTLVLVPLLSSVPVRTSRRPGPRTSLPGSTTSELLVVVRTQTSGVPFMGGPGLEPMS